MACATAVPNGVATGSSCNQGKFCANNLCDFNDGDLKPETGTCAAPCTDDVDCPTPLKCLDYDFSPDGKNRIKACRKVKAGGWRG